MSAELSQRIREVGLALGFDLVGFARAEPGEEASRLREWLARGYAGEMAYLGRRFEERADPRRVLPECRSVIGVAIRYPGGPSSGAPPAEAPARGRVSSYAAGDDYHAVVLDRVRALEAALPHLAGAPVRSRGYVDTGPVLERAWAARAGLGWVGKSTLVIHPRLGARLFLGAILTDLALEPDAPLEDHCGRCRACLDVCPTDAFPEPYVLDARRCLSYTTIELREAIPEALRAGQGAWVHGCDLCMDVCPFEAKAEGRTWPDPLGLRARLDARPEWRAPTLAWLLELDAEAHRTATRRTALRREGHRGLIRNALVAAGNSRSPALRSAIERHAAGEDPVLAEHARWALARLDSADGGVSGSA